MPIELQESKLGKKVEHIGKYKPDLLFPVPRKHLREKMQVPEILPFKGYDVWNTFEISWLNKRGKPQVAIGQLTIPCDSLNLIESKSLKLYLHSLNDVSFDSFKDLQNIIQKDLTAAAKQEIQVNVIPLAEFVDTQLSQLQGHSLDDLDIACDVYQVNADFLKITGNQTLTETLYSHLLRANCLVTGQPDWASIQISYTGKPIDHEGLLKYLVSFRHCNEFGEPAAERIFMDIMRRCAPERLTVVAHFTRRGGIDIKPLRTNEVDPAVINRLLKEVCETRLVR